MVLVRLAIGPFRVAKSAANGNRAERGLAHTWHAKLGRQAIQAQADAVEAK